MSETSQKARTDRQAQAMKDAMKDFAQQGVDSGKNLADKSEAVADATGKSMQQTYPNEIGPDVSTLQRLVDSFHTRIDNLVRERDEARAQQAAAEQARASLQQNMNDQLRQKDEAAATITKQLQDERDRNASQEQADKTRIEDLGKRIADLECPVLIQIAEDDSIAPPPQARAAAWEAKGRSEVREYPCNHFAIYVDPWRSKSIADQLLFLRRHIGSGGRRAAVSGAAA